MRISKKFNKNYDKNNYNCGWNSFIQLFKHSLLQGEKSPPVCPLGRKIHFELQEGGFHHPRVMKPHFPPSGSKCTDSTMLLVFKNSIRSFFSFEFSTFWLFLWIQLFLIIHDPHNLFCVETSNFRFKLVFSLNVSEVC